MKSGEDFIGVGVGAFILNEKNELLMLLRSKNSRVEPGTWMIPGGKVEFNERLEDAVKREAEEELGAEIEVLGHLNTVNHIMKDRGQHFVAVTFRCRINAGEPVIAEPEKHDGLKWFSLDRLPGNLSRVMQLVLEEYQK